MTANHENGFENIKISPKLDETIEAAIQKGKGAKRRNKIKLNLIKYSACTASVFLLFVLGVNCVPAFAESVNEVPILSNIANAVQINYSNNIGTAINKGFSQNVRQTKTSNNVKISITKVVADNKNLYILYTLNGSQSKENLKDILLNSFKITNTKGKALIDTKNILPFLTSDAVNKKGDILIPMNSYGYDCIISSLGNTLDSYSKNQETKGIIQLSADSQPSIAGNKNLTIPDKIKLTFLGFTECYNTNYSKGSYNSFISNFKRKPKSISANCSFDINVNKKLNSIKPECYKNIKFTANNTDFKINSLKIYPTYIEAQIHLGTNKVDSSKCISIINEVGLNTSTLPYLIDEKGNKYMPHKSHVFVDSNNNQTITFDSSYFNEPKELYLVITELDYPNSIIKNSPVKIKIK